MIVLNLLLIAYRIVKFQIKELLRNAYVTYVILLNFN